MTRLTDAQQVYFVAVGVLLASLIQHSQYPVREASAWLWFGAFGLATVVLVVLSLMTLLVAFALSVFLVRGARN